MAVDGMREWGKRRVVARRLRIPNAESSSQWAITGSVEQSH